MRRIVIVNDFEAIMIYDSGRQVRLSHSDGNVRHLVVTILMPSNVNPEVTPRQFLAASTSEDTVDIKIA